MQYVLHTIVFTLILLNVELSSAQNSVSGTVTLVSSDGAIASDGSSFVVFVEGNDDQSRAALNGSNQGVSAPSVSHQDRAFSPRVMPITVGTSVDFLNDDRIFHNAFSLSRAKTFDLGIYPQGASKLVKFDAPGLVRVYCNIHPDMVSNILVLWNRYFDVTEVDGAYEIAGLPNGEFTIRVWSEFAEELSLDVSLADGLHVNADFSATEDVRLMRHNNKFGMPYRERY